jgi:hypothetical protein
MGYPLYLYGPHGTYRVVADDDERDQALAAGFWVWGSDVRTPEPDSAPVMTEPLKKRRGRPPKMPQE